MHMNDAHAALEAGLAALAAALGQPLPADYLALQRTPGPVPGPFGAHEWLRPAAALAQWQLNQELHGSGTLRALPVAADAGVRAQAWHPGWLPLTHDGAGTLAALDLAPAEGGQAGQVILVDAEGGRRRRLGRDLADWLARPGAGLADDAG